MIATNKLFSIPPSVLTIQIVHKIGTIRGIFSCSNNQTFVIPVTTWNMSTHISTVLPLAEVTLPS